MIKFLLDVILVVTVAHSMDCLGIHDGIPFHPDLPCLPEFHGANWEVNVGIRQQIRFDQGVFDVGHHIIDT
jgi:hypothetical protein